MPCHAPPRPALLESWRSDGNAKVWQKRLHQSVKKGGFNTVVVGDECVWFHIFSVNLVCFSGLKMYAVYDLTAKGR
jgi:hypothetical protein